MKKISKKKVVQVKKKSVKRAKASVGSVVAKKRVAKRKVSSRKKSQIRIGFSIFKYKDEPPKARAYDKSNGREVLLHDMCDIPPFVRRELTDDEIADMLLTKDAKR